MENPPQDLNIDRDMVLAIHRVIRAMQDGQCPRCYKIFPEEQMQASDPGDWPAGATAGVNRIIPPKWTGWRCPSCRFQISDKEAAEGLALFARFMEQVERGAKFSRNLEVFEQWRATLVR